MMPPSSPPRGPAADRHEGMPSGYDSYRPSTHRSPSRGRHLEQKGRSPARSVARSRSRPLLGSMTPQSPHHTTTEPLGPGFATVPSDHDTSRSSTDRREIQSILTALFDASNQISAVRWNAEAAAKNLAAAQKSFDASKPGHHPEAIVNYNATSLERAKKAYDALTAEYQTLLVKHSDAIIRLSQAVQPPQPQQTPLMIKSEIEELEQRIMIGFNDHIESYKQSVRKEMDERDRKLMRAFDTRLSEMQSKMDADMRKLMDDRLKQDVNRQVSPVRVEIATLKIEVDKLQKQQDLEQSNRNSLTNSVSEESVAQMSALNSLKSRLEGLEGVQGDMAILQEDSRDVKDSNKSLKTSMDSVKLELAANQGRLINQADRADALEEELASIQNELMKLRDNTVTTQTSPEVSLAPVFSELHVLKTRLASLDSQIQSPANNRHADLQQELEKCGYNTLVEQSRRHELQLQQYQTMRERTLEQPVTLADPNLAIRAVASNLEKWRSHMDQRLEALLEKVVDLSNHYVYLQERYNSTTTQQLHDAIVETMKGAYPSDGWKLAINDLHARLQHSARSLQQRIERLEAKPQTIVDKSPTGITKESWNAADERIARLESRMLLQLNSEQRLQEQRKSFTETTASINSLITAKDQTMKSFVDKQFASITTELTAKSAKISALEHGLQDVAKNIGNLEQSCQMPTASTLLEEVFQKSSTQLDSRWNERQIALEQREDMITKRLDTTDSHLAELRQSLDDEDDTRSDDIHFEPTSIGSLLKWLQTRYISLEEVLHTSLADGQNLPKSWQDRHAQVKEGLLLRDEILDSHVHVLSLGNKSVAIRANITSNDQSRKVFQKRANPPGMSATLRVMKSSYETESTGFSHPPPRAASSTGPVQTSHGTSPRTKRKLASSSDKQGSSGEKLGIKTETTPVRRSPGRPKKMAKLTQRRNGAASSLAGHRIASPEAPVSPSAPIDLSD